MGVKIMVIMGHFSVNLVGKGAFRQPGDKNIKKWKRIVRFNFHSELDMQQNAIEMVEKGIGA